jgi:uncharacterized heparinase superfamily protein
MDENPLGMALEIDAVIAAAKAVQRASITLNLAEVGSFEEVEIIRQDLELGQQVKLEILGKGAHLSRTCGIKNDLKHAYESNGKRLPSATAS